MRKASELKFGEKGIIKDISVTNPSFKRMIEIGFTPGQEIQLVNTSIFNDPLTFALRGTLIALRKSQADCIILR